MSDRTRSMRFVTIHIDSCSLLIRQSDYTDSHKSNDWSSRAALTAASFGRELCLHLPANVEHEQQSLYDNLRNLCAGTTVGKEQPHDCSALPEDPSHSSRVRAGTGSEGRWVTEDDKHAKSFITFDSKKALAADSSNEDVSDSRLHSELSLTPDSAGINYSFGVRRAARLMATWCCLHGVRCFVLELICCL